MVVPLKLWTVQEVPKAVMVGAVVGQGAGRVEMVVVPSLSEMVISVVVMEAMQAVQVDRH